MNCKQGDLAVIVRSAAGNEGKIVECVTLVYEGGPFGYGPRWVTRPTIIGSVGFPRAVLDSCLRPIRPNDGEDETLTWAGKPQQTEVTQ